MSLDVLHIFVDTNWHLPEDVVYLTLVTLTFLAFIFGWVDHGCKASLFLYSALLQHEPMIIWSTAK